MQQEIGRQYGEFGEACSLDFGSPLSPMTEFMMPEDASNFLTKAEIVTKSGETTILNTMVLELSLTQTELLQRISKLEEKIMETTKLKHKIMEVELKLTELEKRSLVPAVSSPFLDMDFDLPFIENSCNGHLDWTIPEIKHQLKNAYSGKTLSLYSPPFYTSLFGYKICLRLHLLGDSIGKSTHLSLFFVVMRGEFDSLLKWPFENKVSLRLLNRSGGRDIVDTFCPDPSSSSFKKPESDMNIASGFPQFMPLKTFMNFICDDTIDIQCKVDTILN